MKKMLIPFFCLVTLFSFGQDSTHADLVGKYTFPGGSVVENVTVRVENGQLFMSSSAGDSPLKLIKADSFDVVNFQGVAVFKRNDQQKVVGVHIDASGYVLEGTKDSSMAQQVTAGAGNYALPLSVAPINAAKRRLQLEMKASEYTECAG